MAETQLGDGWVARLRALPQAPAVNISLGVDVGATAPESLWIRAADLDALLADRPPEPPAETWQLIETAPKDGTPVLVWSPSHGAFAAWNKGWGWHTEPGVYLRRPTHWMPLSDPPTSETADVERAARPPQREER